MEVELMFSYFWIQALREQISVAEMQKKKNLLPGKLGLFST